MSDADRVILHCDLNAYYASVECLARPELKSVPMAVCGDPENRRGIILAKNELAKRRGVLTAETIWQAKKKCPGLVLVPPHHDKYAHYSALVNRVYARFTDLVEASSIDESYLDVTGSLGLFGTGEKIADAIRDQVRGELGLTVSVGVSFNKVFAKLGSDYKKPDATTVITRENYRQILYPLPASAMLYVGKRAAATLKSAGIDTIGDIAAAGAQTLIQLLGKNGETVWEYANGLDQSPVRGPDGHEGAKSIGNGATFRRNLVGEGDVRVAALMLADSVASRLRGQGVRCGTVQVQIKDPSLNVISRQKQLERPSDLSAQIAAAAIEIVRKSWPPRAPIRMLTITAQSLTAGGVEQVSLFQDEPAAHDKREALERTIDDIRHKFGRTALVRGSVLSSDLITAPHEQDGDDA